MTHRLYKIETTLSIQAISKEVPGVPKKMYHICFAHSFHTFLRNLLKHTSKDSQIHGDLLTPPPDSVTRPWRSRCHVLEVSTVLGHAQRCSASGLLGLVSTCGGGIRQIAARIAWFKIPRVSGALWYTTLFKYPPNKKYRGVRSSGLQVNHRRHRGLMQPPRVFR